MTANKNNTKNLSPWDEAAGIVRARLNIDNKYVAIPLAYAILNDLRSGGFLDDGIRT